MSDFRKVTDSFFVSPQISVADVAQAKAQGFTLIINNRPDGESPGQPSADEIGEAARAAGLGYLFAPVVGRPAPGAVAAVREAVDANPGLTLAFCRSGTRSICAWAMGQTEKTTPDELIRIAHAAGYDLSAVLG
jgi:uncharacterized protein (TIGR01244 family)